MTTSGSIWGSLRNKMSFNDRRAWLNNAKLSNIESKKISKEVQVLASCLAEESRKWAQ